MSSFSSDSNFVNDPLLSGHYYLIDISEAIEAYYRYPSFVRMHLASDAAEVTEYDMLDIELTALIPCLAEDGYHTQELDRHNEQLLEEGIEMIIDGIVPSPYANAQSISNTPEQSAHAQAVHNLGGDIYRILKEHGMYDRRGCLVGEYHRIMVNGVMVLRDWRR